MRLLICRGGVWLEEGDLAMNGLRGDGRPVLEVYPPDVSKVFGASNCLTPVRSRFTKQDGDGGNLAGIAIDSAPRGTREAAR